MQEPDPYLNFNQAIQDLSLELGKAYEDLHDTKQRLLTYKEFYDRLRPLQTSLNTTMNSTTTLISNMETLLTNLQNTLNDSADLALS